MAMIGKIKKTIYGGALSAPGEHEPGGALTAPGWAMGGGSHRSGVGWVLGGGGLRLLPGSRTPIAPSSFSLFNSPENITIHYKIN